MKRKIVALLAALLMTTLLTPPNASAHTMDYIGPWDPSSNPTYPYETCNGQWHPAGQACYETWAKRWWLRDHKEDNSAFAVEWRFGSPGNWTFGICYANNARVGLWGLCSLRNIAPSSATLYYRVGTYTPDDNSIYLARYDTEFSWSSVGWQTVN